jgi:HlyD family secretion protein
MNDATTNPVWIPEMAEPLEAPAAVTTALPTRRRRWPWLVALVAVLAAGTVAVVQWRVGRVAPVTFETVKVDRGRIVVQVTASGTVSALKTVLVGSQVSGRVAELHADFNDIVKKGQLLARLDTQLFQSALQQARASQAVARSNVAKAAAQLQESERQLAREKTLSEGKFLAPEVVETTASSAAVARAALDGARAQAQQAAASVRQAELNLAMTAIYAPIDGVVISRSVDVGQTVAASLQAPTIFTLAEDMRKMEVDAHVTEGDVAKLTAGMPVTFTVDAFAGRTFRGKLRQVRNAAVTVQNVVTYDAIVDVDNEELELRPGMTANVTFIVAERDGVLRIPNAALRFRPPRTALAPEAADRAGTTARGPGGDPAADRGSRSRSAAGAGTAPRAAASDRKVVYTQQGSNQVRAQRVRVGLTDGSYTELVEGPVTEGTVLVSDLDDGRAPAAGNRSPTAATPGGMAPVPGMGGGGRRWRQ